VELLEPDHSLVLMNLESGVDATGGHLLSCGKKQGTSTPSFLQQIYQCVSVAALAMASYFVISHFVLQSVQVVGVSMAPTLHDSQQYLLNRWVYYFRAPRRSDVVVLRDPVDKGFAVKRVIGTAGDRVNLKDGKVFVNGCKLNEPYLASGMPTFPYLAENEQSFTLGKDQFFVLGDNRRNSADSRTYGPVPRRSILGLIVR
jgi:signal peptidase I